MKGKQNTKNLRLNNDASARPIPAGSNNAQSQQPYQATSPSLSSSSQHRAIGLGVNHPHGFNSTSSTNSQEADAYAGGLVPLLPNVKDSTSSMSSSSRRPYAPGGFSNAPRTPLSAGSSNTSYFEEKKDGATYSGLSGLSPPLNGTRQTNKIFADFNMEPEADDYLHNPDPAKDSKKSVGKMSLRGCMNVGTLLLLGIGLLALFAGYPVISWLTRPHATTKGGFNLGGTNATGQVADLQVGRSLIDPDTPASVLTRRTLDGTNRKMNLVFSDEFNQDGRSFYPGDDPFWTAVDLHYWGTQNYEWYDPSSITTSNGSLSITLDQVVTHNLNFRGGMLQSWNQFCFTGGYIEVSMVLPGAPDIAGLWPAAWTMGNLGRAGYGATTDGLWPYTYDTCDVGTLPNQTYFNKTGPVAALTTGVYVDTYGPSLSYLPGQRLSRCTCPTSDDHPGPKHPDGTWVGRSAPEIDIIEAAASHVRGTRGYASMSAQIAPFNTGYDMPSGPGYTQFYSPDASLNSYTGAAYQQAASGLVYTRRNAYQETQGLFSQYGYEYSPGADTTDYIIWTLDGNPMWRLNSRALGPDSATEISQRPIPYEPMYILLNLGISSSFTTVDWENLNWPAVMLVDYVRVWQVEGEENVGCDPAAAPTQDYINKHKEAYYNANLTTWTEPRARGGYNAAFPGNRLMNQC